MSVTSIFCDIEIRVDEISRYYFKKLMYVLLAIIIKTRFFRYYDEKK